MEEIHFAYWLMNLPGIGSLTVERLFESFGSYRNIWEAGESALAGQEFKLSKAQIQTIVTSREPEKIMASCEKLKADGITFLYRGHPYYPARLDEIRDAPRSLYVMGRLPDPRIRSIAIVGARECSEYGRFMARNLGVALADAGVQVISGLARGVDSISQTGALSHGGYSCGVLGCGVDICYPDSSRKLYDALLEKGGLISEYPPGTTPRSGLFPQRNRIISALSDAVVVVEARERSGSLITADLALEQGKDVYAVPGRATDSLSHGCNRLIKQGAGLILSADEFLQDLALNPVFRKTSDDRTSASDACSSTVTDPIDTKLLSCMDFYPKSLNAIQDETGLDTGTLMTHLCHLSMCGLILQNGSHYMKVSV